MANVENLKRGRRPSSEAVRNGEKGGVASGAARHRGKSMKVSLAEAIQTAYEARQREGGLDPSRNADGGHTEAEGA